MPYGSIWPVVTALLFPVPTTCCGLDSCAVFATGIPSEGQVNTGPVAALHGFAGVAAARPVVADVAVVARRHDAGDGLGRGVVGGGHRSAIQDLQHVAAVRGRASASASVSPQ